MRFVFWLVGLSALAGCEEPNTYVEPPPPKVTVATPLVEDIIDYLEMTGTTVASGRVDVRARVSGELQSMHFQPGTGAEHNRSRIDGLGAGVSYLITHCADGDDELASIAPDWRQRDEERRIYSDGSMARCFDDRAIQTIGMRPLRDLLRTRV